MKKNDFYLIRRMKKKKRFYTTHAIHKNLILAQSIKTFVNNLIVIKAYIQAFVYETTAASCAHFPQIWRDVNVLQRRRDGKTNTRKHRCDSYFFGNSHKERSIHGREKRESYYVCYTINQGNVSRSSFGHSRWQTFWNKKGCVRMIYSE